MPDLHQDIRNWLHKRPDWIQQAAEMLLAAGNVSDAGIQTLVERLKTKDGQQVTKTRPLDALAPAAAQASALRLVDIGEICGIENLGPRNPLAFGNGNLSLIYGHNGSGKSGYTRLLKKICGKPRAAELRPNVFQPPPAIRQCRIGYRVDGELRQPEWPANSPPIEDLRAVDIFDTDTALFYLSEETAVTYIPPAVALFEALAAVCERVTDRLRTEQAALVNALPSLPQEYVQTDAGTAYGALKADISDAQLQQLTRWSAEDDQVLAKITQRLNVQDPSALAQSKRAAKMQIDEIEALLRTADAAFAETALANIRTVREVAQVKRRIATESADVASAKLNGVGSDTWREMWRAARAYSQTVYTGIDFPATDDESRCVLCHQGLDDQAKARLRDFEAFVQGQLESEASAAEAAYREALKALPNALMPEEIATRCQAGGLTEEDWAERLGEFWRQVGRSREILLDDEADGPVAPLAMPDDLLGQLAMRSRALAEDAAQHEEDAASFDRVQATKDKQNLEARRWMSQQAESIRHEVARLRQRTRYEDWKQMANSRLISVKAGEIADQIITQAFVKRFNGELKALGASRIRVELTKTRTERGRVLHRLRLKGAQTGQDLPDSVLSEGERRVVGLAAFLADVSEQPHSAPFIFDDPISSLDHDFEWHVATRLAALAQTRQVLVFTHRLSLYGAVEEAAKKFGDEWKKQHLVKHCIESYSGVAGHPADQAAWNANTTKANNILVDRLNAAKRAGEAGGAEAYRQLAQGICSELRKLLERTVEEDLLNGVVKRHRRSVTTDNLLKPLPCITPEDCKLIDDLMTKYSCYEHSQSPETPVFLPEEAELREDLESIKHWREEFKQRQKGTSS